MTFSDINKITSPEFLKKNKLTIHDLLELLDGPISLKNGEIFIMTTNYIKNIDKALLRPGRINHLLELKKSTLLDMKNIIDFYYEMDISIDKLNGFKDHQFTPALISETCNYYSQDLDGCLHYLSNYDSSQ